MVMRLADEIQADFMSDEVKLEDRKLFTKNLGCLLSQTREGVIGCELEVVSDYEEYVVITYRGGAQKMVNVSMDSYAAIVKDVIKQF